MWPARRLTESRAKRISAGNEPRDGRGGVTTITGIGDIWTGCSAGAVILRREDGEGSRYAGDTTEMIVRGSYCVQPSPPRLYKSRNVSVAELDNTLDLASHCATELVSWLALHSALAQQSTHFCLVFAPPYEQGGTII